MTDTQKARFALILEAQRQQIEYELNARKEQSGKSEFGLRNPGRLSALLRLVDTALQQLRDGTYGTCAGCECEIPMNRLQAVPWSAFCPTCQEMIEATRPLTGSRRAVGRSKSL
jgi:RNA polymerase-binding transcription factor DksA